MLKYQSQRKSQVHCKIYLARDTKKFKFILFEKVKGNEKSEVQKKVKEITISDNESQGFLKIRQ